MLSLNSLSEARPRAVFSSKQLRLMVFAVATIAWCDSLWAQRGKVEILFQEESTARPLSVMLRLENERGAAQRILGAPFQNGWSLIEESFRYRGRAGNYTYRTRRSPEYAKASGGFTLDKTGAAEDLIEIPRFANMADEGYYSGDLSCYVSRDEVQPWLSAAGLSTVVSTSKASSLDEESSGASAEPTWDPREGVAYVDRRNSGGIATYGWKPPAQVPDQLPSTRLLVMAKGTADAPVHCSAVEPWRRDFPIWLASEKLDSFMLLGEGLSDDSAKSVKLFYDTAPPQIKRGASAPGRIVEYLYWQTLEAGFRLPPNAGSGFGKGTTCLGYNRVYVSSASPTNASWWKDFERGQCFVSNGPLLRARVNGYLPGATFQVGAETLKVEVTANVTVSDPVDYLEVVFNGEPLYHAALDEFAAAGGRIPIQEIDQSGWLLVRVVTRVDTTYRMATTAPFYFERGGQGRISRKSVRMFLDWLEAAEKEVAELPKDEVALHRPYLDAARRAWTQRLKSANAE
ncbi:MAG TPA: hypothetical protein DDW52_18940 [Planctomycetaceae bacterium]|nr:hypothetical protein [Planctomycetaceae bacterium]